VAATTQAFQDCMDAIETAGGGTLYIPAAGVADSYFLRRPIWCGVENITVMGEGSNASTLTGYGPCFITAKHPTRWDCAVTSYTDVDTSATVTVKTGGIVTNRERYRMDLTEFMSGGTYPPGGGRPALGVSTGAGYFGLRTRRNVMGGRYPQASLASGENNGGSNFFTQWSHYDKIEWNFIFYQHETTLVGAIAGAGSLQRPDPWILWGDGTDYILDLALTDSDGIRRTWIRCKFAQSASVGIHRITIQFDPANATDANRIRASVDRTRVAVARYNFSDATNSYHAMNTWNSSGNFADLWDVWNRVGNWHGSDFTICNESSKVGSKDNLEISSGFTDYTVLLVSAFKDFKHDLGSIGATITKVGGAVADDSFVWPYTSGADSDTTAIGWMANETYNSWSPASTIDDVNLMAFGKGRSKCWGYMHPKGGGDAMTATVKNQLYRGFATQSRDNHQNSCGMLVGAVLNVNIEDVHFKNGYYWSLAFMRQRVCYPLRIRNVRFSKGVHLSDCSIWGEDWVFDYARNCAILGTGAELVLKDLYGLSFDALATGIIRWHAGESIAAGLDIQKANFNIEGDGIWGQNGPCVYYQKAYNHPGWPCDLHRRYRSELDIDRESRLRTDRHRQRRNSPDGTRQGCARAGQDRPARLYGRSQRIPEYIRQRKHEPAVRIGQDDRRPVVRPSAVRIVRRSDARSSRQAARRRMPASLDTDVDRDPEPFDAVVGSIRFQWIRLSARDVGDVHPVALLRSHDPMADSQHDSHSNLRPIDRHGP